MVSVSLGCGECSVCLCRSYAIVSCLRRRQSSRMRIYLGHDSGMTHLAAALSIPTIVCLVSTSPRRWLPLGHRVSIQLESHVVVLDWTSVECRQEKVCLRISPERIIEGCRELLM